MRGMMGYNHSSITLQHRTISVNNIEATHTCVSANNHFLKKISRMKVIIGARVRVHLELSTTFFAIYQPASHAVLWHVTKE